MAMLRKLTANPVKDQPFVIKLNRSIPLDGDDLATLARLLDIIVEG
jgi:hypothetical protein